MKEASSLSEAIFIATIDRTGEGDDNPWDNGCCRAFPRPAIVVGLRGDTATMDIGDKDDELGLLLVGGPGGVKFKETDGGDTIEAFTVGTVVPIALGDLFFILLLLLLLLLLFATDVLYGVFVPGVL
jgi:hypothetical protein